VGKTYSGHGEGDTRPGQTWKKPKDLSTYDREGRGFGEGGGVFTVLSVGTRQSVWLSVPVHDPFTSFIYIRMFFIMER
jgi:hypothetical protein